MIEYTASELDDLLEHLERLGWWVSRGVPGRYGNTKLMRALKYHCTNPEECRRQIGSVAPEEYRIIFVLSLEDLALEINNEKMMAIIKWRFENRK